MDPAHNGFCNLIDYVSTGKDVVLLRTNGQGGLSASASASASEKQQEQEQEQQQPEEEVPLGKSSSHHKKKDKKKKAKRKSSKLSAAAAAAAAPPPPDEEQDEQVAQQHDVSLQILANIANGDSDDDDDNIHGILGGRHHSTATSHLWVEHWYTTSGFGGHSWSWFL